MYVYCYNIISNYIFCNYCFAVFLLCYNVNSYFVTKFVINSD